MIQRPIEILLVEDSPGDVWLTLETLSQGPVPKNIHVVRNGEAALDYLFRRGVYVNATRPDLVLLDLNLPRRDGLEVLREVKRDPGLRAITVVMLTTSDAPSDVNAAYDLNVNCYIVKPVDLEEFTIAIRGIEDFWMSMAILPTTVAPTSESKEREDSMSNGGPEASSSGSGSVSRLAVRRRRPEPIRWRVRTARTAPGCRGSGRF